MRKSLIVAGALVCLLEASRAYPAAWTAKEADRKAGTHIVPEVVVDGSGNLIDAVLARLSVNGHTLPQIVEPKD